MRSHRGRFICRNTVWKNEMQRNEQQKQLEHNCGEADDSRRDPLSNGSSSHLPASLTEVQGDGHKE